MEFNYDYLVSLFEKSGEKKKDFGKAIFGGNSRMGPEYFEHLQKINLIHLQRLSEHYDVPWTNFFHERFASHDTYNNVGQVVSHSNVEVATLNFSNNGEAIQALKQTITNLKTMIEDKNGIINLLRQQIDILSQVSDKLNDK